MKKLIFILILSFISYFSVSQENFIYLNNSKYPSTGELDFQGAKVEIAINKNEGLLRLVVNSFEMQGQIRIFLEDGNFINCMDYGYIEPLVRSYASTYKLTESEMDYLCKLNIDKIRYTNAFGNHYVYSRYNDKTTSHGIQTAITIKELREKYNDNPNFDYNALLRAAKKISPSKSSDQKNNINTLKDQYELQGFKFNFKKFAYTELNPSDFSWKVLQEFEQQGYFVINSDRKSLVIRNNEGDELFKITRIEKTDNGYISFTDKKNILIIMPEYSRLALGKEYSGKFMMFILFDKDMIRLEEELKKIVK